MSKFFLLNLFRWSSKMVNIGLLPVIISSQMVHRVFSEHVNLLHKIFETGPCFGTFVCKISCFFSRKFPVIRNLGFWFVQIEIRIVLCSILAIPFSILSCQCILNIVLKSFRYRSLFRQIHQQGCEVKRILQIVLKTEYIFIIFTVVPIFFN